MSNPTVSFVVPCYKLAHLLGDCLESILSQTYTDFEVLVMDDCSPDNTAEVATRFGDSRIKYIRNEYNLGHLRNYNTGIELSRGEYVWLISADDRLRRPYVLDRYLSVLAKHPEVGYAFCPGVAVHDGCEEGVLQYSCHGHDDAIFPGRHFLKTLYCGNSIIAASGLARKECYERISYFPLDLPHAGDWYLWCAFALNYDVAYFAEPMVVYRSHDLNIMTELKRRDRRILIADQLSVQWRIKYTAEKAGHASSVRTWLQNVSTLYSYCLVSEAFDSGMYRMTFDDFEQSLEINTVTPTDRRKVRARVYAGFADGCYRHGHVPNAHTFYLRGLCHDPLMPRVWAKEFLLRLGKPGNRIRDTLWPYSRWATTTSRSG